MKTKRFLSILLSLVLVLGMFPGMSLTASAADSTTEITPSNTSGTMTITLTIKAAQTITASDVTATYGDTDKSVSASVTTPTTGGGAISYAVKDGSGDYIDVASDGKLTIKKVPSDGKAYVTVTAAATDDYAAATKDVTVNINTKAMTVSAENVTATVDGQPHGITVNVTDPASGATVKYGTEEGSYTLDASPTQTEAGTKTVYYQVTADNYTTYNGSATVTVSAKQTQTITASDVNATYGDTDKKIEATTTSGGGALSYTVKSGDAVNVDDSGNLTIVKAGSAVITVTAAENDTYASATKDVNVTVNTKAMTVSAEDVNVTVDGQPHGITVNVTDPASSATVKYGTEEGSYTLDASPTQTEVGEKTVYYQVTADNYTTYTGSAKVTVSAKQTQTITADDVTVTYGDADKKVTATTNGGGAISYAVKAGSEDYIEVNATTGALTIKKVPADGKAYVTVTAAGNATYEQATKDVTVTINKANAVAATVTANNRTYDGTEKPLVTVTGEPTGGEMQYALGTATEATQPYTTSIPSKTDAGTYYVWYIVKGDEDHNDLQAVCVETSIAKAPGAQAVPAHMYFEEPSDDYTSFNLAISCHSDEYHLNLVEGQEYVLVNKGAEPDWSKAQELDEQHGAILYTGLGAATEYDIWSRTKETANTLPGEPALFRYTTGIFGLELKEEALIGNTLTVITDPERIEGLTWQWFYADEDEDGIIVRGEAITNATSSSYTVKEADLGKYLWYEMYKGGNRLESGNRGPVKIGINPTVTLEGWAYGDTPNTPVVTGNTGNGEVTFEYAIKGSDVPSTENVPVFPGTYTVYAYIEGSGDYAYGFAEADFVITEGTAATYMIVGNVTVPTADGATTYNNVPDADVELRQGNIIFAAAKTDENGRYSFTSVPNGEYNIVVTGNINSSGADDSGNGSGESDGTATTKTEYVRVADSDQTIDIVMPFYNVSSMVNVKGKTPAAVVAGLDDAAAGSLTDAEKTGGVTTTMTMEIESTGDLTNVPETQLTDEQKKTKTEQEKIKEANGNLGNDASENLEFLDMSIYRKTQKEGESAQIESVHDLNTVLEILLPYDTLNRLFRIFRYHGTVATAFRQLSERPKSGFTDGTFYVGSGFVALYGNGFSTYAIGYTEKPAENQGGSSYVPYVPSTPATITYTITFDANGGTGSMSSKQYSGATKLPANTFTRSGYTFAGWSTKADGTGVSYDDKDDISPSTDITLYAQWKTEEALATPTPEPVPATVDTVTKEEKAQGKIDINSAFKVYQSGKKVVAEWGEVEDADLYEVYATYCGGTYSLIKTVTDGSLTCSFKKLDGVKIDFSKNFKVYVAAYRTIDGEKKLIAKTIKAHVVGSENKKRTNASSIELEKSKYSVKVGNTFEIKATTILVDPKKKQLSNAHANEFRYLSTDTSIATVSKDGTVTGVSKGTCYIWVYSRNGLGVKVKVTVK